MTNQEKIDAALKRVQEVLTLIQEWRKNESAKK